MGAVFCFFLAAFEIFMGWAGSGVGESESSEDDDTYFRVDFKFLCGDSGTSLRSLVVT